MSAPEPRICENCRVVITHDGADWVHPLDLRDKFSRVACVEPRPGRPAKPGEIRFGRGRSASRDKLSLHSAIGELAQPTGTPLTVGVDGSYKVITTDGKVRKPMSWAYITTSGLYGLGTSNAPGSVVGGDRPLQGELRAVFWALQRVGDDYPVTLLTDSMDAVELMADWRAGGTTMPSGYTRDRVSGREATLVQLARLIRDAQDRVRVRWVRSHSGEPLNEGADALAKYARFWAAGQLERTTVAADARRAALAALTRHADKHLLPS